MLLQLQIISHSFSDNPLRGRRTCAHAAQRPKNGGEPTQARHATKNKIRAPALETQRHGARLAADGRPSRQRHALLFLRAHACVAPSGAAFVASAAPARRRDSDPATLRRPCNAATLQRGAWPGPGWSSCVGRGRATDPPSLSPPPHVPQKCARHAALAFANRRQSVSHQRSAAAATLARVGNRAAKVCLVEVSFFLR